MRMGICTSVERLEEAHEADFDFAELGAYLLLPDGDDAAFAGVRNAILSARIRVEAFNIFLPPQLKVTGPEVDMDAVARRMSIVIERAADVGAEVIVFGSGGARNVPDGYPAHLAWDQLQHAAMLAADIGSKHGIIIAVEPLHRGVCSILNTVSEGADFVDAINHPNCALLADLFHMAANDEPLESLKNAAPKLAHVHIPTPSLAEDDSYDFRGFFRSLVNGGYSESISIEDNNGLLAHTQPPLTQTYRAIREQIQRLVDEQYAGR